MHTNPLGLPTGTRAVVTEHLLKSAGCALAGGVAHLMLVRGQVSRAQMLSMFLKMEQGDHVRSKCVEIVRCVAYRIAPLDPGPPGVLTLDGEVIRPYAPVQARVLPRAATVLG